MIALECSCISDAGGGPDANEDAVLADAAAGIFVVADGIGGRPGGQQASIAAAEAFARCLGAAPTEGRAAPDALRRAVAAANQAVRDVAAADPDLAGLGTTLAAAVVAGLRAGVAHVGDSRVYLFRDGALTQLTQDHTLVAELVARRDLSAEGAKRSPLRNVLSRSVGTHPSVEADVQVLDLRPGDWLLLATDGLAGAVDAARLEAMVAERRERTAREMCETIVQEALRNEPQDNISLIAVRVGAAPPDP